MKSDFKTDLKKNAVSFEKLKKKKASNNAH